MPDNRLPTNQSLIDLKDSIDLLTANINRTASNIPYDNNLTIKGKIDEIDAKTAADIPYSSGVSVKQKIDNKGLCYRDMTLTFDENGSYRFDNDASLLAIVGDANKIIRAEVLNGSTGYMIAMSTYLTYKYFLLKNPTNFSTIPSTSVSARIYWIDNIISKN